MLDRQPVWPGEQRPDAVEELGALIVGQGGQRARGRVHDEQRLDVDDELLGELLLPERLEWRIDEGGVPRLPMLPAEPLVELVKQPDDLVR